MHGCDADLMFAIKGTMRQMPAMILVLSLIITTVMFGFQLKLFEAALSKASG